MRAAARHARVSACECTRGASLAWEPTAAVLARQEGSADEAEATWCRCALARGQT